MVSPWEFTDKEIESVIFQRASEAGMPDDAVKLLLSRLSTYELLDLGSTNRKWFKAWYEVKWKEGDLAIIGSMDRHYPVLFFLKAGYAGFLLGICAVYWGIGMCKFLISGL
jgi:hypothetical protein